MENVKEKATLDVVGLYCPASMLLASQQLKGLGSNEILKILASDPDIIKDMPIWCKQTGNKFLGFEKEGEIYKMYIKKG